MSIEMALLILKSWFSRNRYGGFASEAGRDNWKNKQARAHARETEYLQRTGQRPTTFTPGQGINLGGTLTVKQDGTRHIPGSGILPTGIKSIFNRK